MIRVARPEDASLVHRVMLSAFEEYRHIDVPSSALDETVDSIEAALRSGSEHALLFYRDEIAVGACRFKVESDALYFFRLSVCPQERGRGIAKSILIWLENHALNNHTADMCCRVRMSAPRNIQLYKSVGFTVHREEVVTNPNGFPVETVFMKKKLLPCAAAASSRTPAP